MQPELGLVRVWKRHGIREILMSYLSREDLISCRMVCRSVANQAAPDLFSEITITFRSRTLTRPTRMFAFKRIGKYIQKLTFKIPHTAETFLPPIINSAAGTEQTFVYMPQRHQASPENPKYGGRQMTDLLVKQYPPLFHAATDVPSFVRAFSVMTNLRHLKINCEGQNPSHRYRRSVVDYALISLRMAVEQAPLKSLEELSLLSVHPAAAFYLQSNMGYGSSPGSQKRWSQIRSLTIRMESFPHNAGLPTDHLKHLHAYLQGFPALEKLVFRWQGERGPSPLSLASEPCLQASKQSLSHHRISPSLRPLKYYRLRQMELVNVTTDAPQIASLILSHGHTLREFNLQDITFRSGTWDDALAPLTQLSGNEQWKEKLEHERTVDVPIVLSPAGVSQQQLQKVIRAMQKQKDGLRKLAKARACEKFWGRPSHMKRLLPSSVVSWR